MTTLRFMDLDIEETFRGRVYGGDDEDDRRREAFMRELAGPGVIDCPAYDPWVQALQARGWLPDKPELEPAPGGGKHGRWRLTERGRSEMPK